MFHTIGGGGGGRESLADPKGCTGYASPPRFNFFPFHAVFGKFLPNNKLVPPLGNPGSATGEKGVLPSNPVTFGIPLSHPTGGCGVMRLNVTVSTLCMLIVK